jgi:hypothetical protein
MQLTYFPPPLPSFIDSVKFVKSHEPCEILGYYAASSDNFLQAVRDSQSSRFRNGFLNPEDGLSRNVGKNYHYSLRNIPEERSSRVKFFSSSL